MNNDVTVITKSNFPQLFRPANKRFTAIVNIDGDQYSGTAKTRDKAISAAFTAADILGGYELHLAEPKACKTFHPLIEDLRSLKNVAVGIPVFLAKSAWKYLKGGGDERLRTRPLDP